jgi:hypothetical protein
MTPPEMVSVESDAVEATGYDRERRELWVHYRDGGTYVYSAVPERVYREFLAADSMGAYVNREIKPIYEARQA